MQTLRTVTWFNKAGLAILVLGVAYLVAQGVYIGAAGWGLALAYIAWSVRRSVTAKADDVSLQRV